MKLSSQAITLIVIYFLLTLVAMVSSVYHKTFSAGSIVGLILWLLIAAVFVYDTNCLTYGSCDVWSWVRTILYGIIPLFVMLLILYILLTSKSDKQQAEENGRKAQVVVSSEKN